MRKALRIISIITLLVFIPSGLGFALAPTAAAGKDDMARLGPRDSPGAMKANPDHSSQKSVKINRDISGVAYYPASGRDMKTVSELLRIFPKLNSFVLVDQYYSGDWDCESLAKAMKLEAEGFEVKSHSKEGILGKGGKFVIHCIRSDGGEIDIIFYGEDCVKFIPREVNSGWALSVVNYPGDHGRLPSIMPQFYPKLIWETRLDGYIFVRRSSPPVKKTISECLEQLPSKEFLGGEQLEFLIEDAHESYLFRKTNDRSLAQMLEDELLDPYRIPLTERRALIIKSNRGTEGVRISLEDAIKEAISEYVERHAVPLEKARAKISPTPASDTAEPEAQPPEESAP